MFETILSDKNSHRTQIYKNTKGQIEICISHFEDTVTKRIFDNATKTLTPEVPLMRKSACNFTQLQSGNFAELVYRDWRKGELGYECNGGHYSFVISEDGIIWEAIPITCEAGSYFTFNDRILQLDSGRIIVPICYEPRKYVEEGSEKGGWIGTFYSDDEGTSWKRSDWVEGNNCHHHMAEPICVDLGDDCIKMFCRTADGYMFECTSFDCGETWGEEKATTLRMPCSPFIVKRDPYSGYVFVLWNNSFPGPAYQYTRSPLCMAVSKDNTETWEFICEVENDPFCIYGYPSIYFTENEIMMTYDIVQGARNFDKSRMYPKLKTYLRDELTVRKEYRVPLFFTSD